MEIAAGRCLRVCSRSSSTLLPAASPSRRILSGRSSATLMVLVPMEPVLPRRTTLRILRSRQHMPQIQVHNGRIKQQAVQQVEHAADAGEEPARIFRPGFAFEEGFDQIPNYGTNAQDDP